MPKLRVLDIRGSFFWVEDGDGPVSLPMLERLTWGCLGIKSSLFQSIVTPALRYLCLTRSCRDDRDYEEGDVQDFPDAITDCPRIPILPNLEELRYDINTNC